MLKPEWLKVRAPVSESYFQIKERMQNLKLATVCQEARCPNIGECWAQGTATFMILGEVCTRGCKFCHVKTGHPNGRVDPTEPQKVAHSILEMNLKYVVITSVDRDDLPDLGAYHFAQTVRAIHEKAPGVLVEILTPDFQGKTEWIDLVKESFPDVFAHNIETVKRLTPRVRDPRAKYEQSLQVLAHAKDNHLLTKSSIMLGLGETDDEIFETLSDLRKVKCDVVTLGQYLQPTPRHLKVEKWIAPTDFKKWEQIALKMGFLYVASGPLVRSSYKAGEYFIKNRIEQLRKGHQEHGKGLD